jgi:hypothetical protein
MPGDISARERALPGPDAGEFAWLRYRQHSVVSRAQALEFMSSSALNRKVASGRWTKGHRGVYLTHNGPTTERQRLWIAVLAVGGCRPTLLGGLSALRVLGLRRFTSDRIHLLIPARSRAHKPPPGVAVHRTEVLPSEDCRDRDDPPCTSAPRAVVDAAQWARTDDEARTIIAICFQQRLVGGNEIDKVLARMPRARRRALIVETVRDTRTGSETLSELDLVALCRRFGLPTPTRQVLRTDATGRSRYLDALFEKWGLRVEVHGAHHMYVDQWWGDMDRQNDLATKEEVMLAFPGWKLRHRPAEVADRIRRALLDAGWRPGDADLGQ